MDTFDMDGLLLRLKTEFFENGENFKDSLERIALEEEFKRCIREFYYKLGKK